MLDDGVGTNVSDARKQGLVILVSVSVSESMLTAARLQSCQSLRLRPTMIVITSVMHSK